VSAGEKMKKERTDLLVTAYHEAGHAAAAYFQELPFTEVHIIPGKGCLGKLEQEPVAFDTYPKGDTTFIDLEKRIIKAFAGIVAEAHHTGRLQWRYGAADFEAAFGLAMLRHSEGSFAEVEAFLKYARVRTHELVKHPHHWAAIGALASALVERQRLSYTEAADVMQSALAPLWRSEGHPRSWVELHRSNATSIGLAQALTRPGLRRLK